MAEDFPETALKYNVSAVPKFVLFRNGVQVDVLDGADPIQLNKKIQALVTTFKLLRKYKITFKLILFNHVMFRLQRVLQKIKR